ncbi:MAG: TROVE domain protein [Pelotomaculum sp. PtaB.Bin013]|nr:MAG: TROVE domain protein [Pelotomaculum sp. PtaB.Bin013]
MKTNIATKSFLQTHEGAPAKRIDTEAQLRRSLMACMLWESEFYEDGESIADRIASLVPQAEPQKVAAMAVEARKKMKLRHASLWVVREMARQPKHKVLVADTLAQIIQRADELAEFVALYWKDGKQPLSKQVKKGLAQAFTKFDAYQLAKYDRDGAVKLRDVLFLCHAKPKDAEQGAVWKQLVDDTLPVPDTWEVSLSAGKDKKETWERLLTENKLGGLALLRNLRNMAESKVDEGLIFSALDKMKVERILPFRFIAAAKYVPQWETYLEKAILKCLDSKEKLPGRTVLLVDVSGSMDSPISKKSDLMWYDTANGLAILARELCEQVAVYSFSNNVVRIPNRHGFALRDAIVNSQDHGGTWLGKAVQHINGNETYDRLIVLTDEQSHDAIPNPAGKGYMINVAAYKNGVGYGAWTHIDGWSEAALDYIFACEGTGDDLQ